MTKLSGSGFHAQLVNSTAYQKPELTQGSGRVNHCLRSHNPDAASEMITEQLIISNTQFKFYTAGKNKAENFRTFFLANREPHPA